MPRIISGLARGRHIKAPSKGVRPATARARTALFDYLAGFITGARVLDLYSGSGGLGLEALSRGAAEAWFVDSSRHAVEIARENADRLGFGDACHFARREVFGFLRNCSEYQAGRFDLIFAAPPYRSAQPQKILDLCADSGILAPEAAVCLEYSRHTPGPNPVGFRLDRRRVFGETVIEVWDYTGERERAFDSQPLAPG
jgi:16S rRNA (guanine966-N2)-methyltransferase